MSELINSKKALGIALKDIEKRFGKGSVMQYNDFNMEGIDFISSGSLLIDDALGGGFPRGRIVEIYGPESSGKTTLALHVIAETQKNGGVVAFIDAEHALDLKYAEKLGVKVDELLLSQPDTGEQALEIAEALVRSGDVDTIVIDSVAALVPEAEINGEMGDSHIGLQARLMSQAMRKMSGIISKTNTLAIFINQIREKVGVMFGNPETTPGGRALKYYSSVRVEVRRGEAQKSGTDIVGGIANIKTVKNKVYSPFKTASVGIVFGEGFDTYGEIVDYAVDKGIIIKSGSWYSYGDSKIGQGRENSKKYLIDNPDVLKEIKNKITELKEKRA